MRILALAALLPALLAIDASAQGVVLDRIVVDRPAENAPRRPRWRMRLKQHRVRIRIDDQAARTEVTQVFFNPNPWVVEGRYLFPLPENASVSRFTMRMGGKQVPGEILDAKRASEIYRSIVHRRRDPGLLEYAGRRLLRARLFPIPARGDMKVTLSFEQVLPTVGGMVEMVYPMRSDKFGPGPVHTAGEIDVRAEAGVATLFSPTHPLDVVRRGPDHVRASFEQSGARGDRDLRVLYGLGRKDLGLSLATHDPAGEDGYFLMLLSPNRALAEGDRLPKDMVFVLDTSGSMGERGGKKVAQAKAALSYALGRLGPDDRFNVIAFATEARPFRDALLPATKENVAAALAYVKGLEATGGTAIHDALLAAVAAKSPEGRVPIVFFLTDGEPTIGPTEPDRIARAVREANGDRARLFVFGVGDDVNAKLLTDLADGNGGTGHFVSEREDIELKVSALYDKVAAPVLTDAALKIEGLGEYDVFPRRPGDLFRGQQVAVVGRYRNAGPRAITLTGRLGDRDVTLVYEGTFGDEGGRDYLARQWAVRKVGFLLNEIRRNGEKRELVDEVRKLGTRFGIVTPYTSFLVVEEREMLGRRLRRLAEERRDDAGPEPAGAPAAGLRAELKAAEEDAEEMEAAKEALAGGAESGRGAVAAARHALDYERGSEARRVGVKHVAGKAFRYAKGVWVDLDIARAKDAPVRRVRYLGEAWSELAENPKLARYLSVGPNVQVLYEGTVYEIHE